MLVICLFLANAGELCSMDNESLVGRLQRCSQGGSAEELHSRMLLLRYSAVRKRCCFKIEDLVSQVFSVRRVEAKDGMVFPKLENRVGHEDFPFTKV